MHCFGVRGGGILLVDEGVYLAHAEDTMNRRTWLVTFVAMAPTLVGFAAPIPKSLRKPEFLDLRTMSSGAMWEWSQDYDRWLSLVVHAAPNVEFMEGGPEKCDTQSIRYWNLCHLASLLKKQPN